MKKTRQNIILEIIGKNEITTQEELRRRLEREGVEVTQATLSRDINELGLTKAPGTGVYIKRPYPKAEYPQIFRDSVIGADHAMNTVVLKCRVGTAQAACAALDQVGRDGIVGTIAGDDTIFALMRTEPEAAKFVRELKEAVNSGGRT